MKHKIYFGRGNGLAKKPGNRLYRETIKTKKPIYQKATTNSLKNKISDDVYKFFKKSDCIFYYKRDKSDVKWSIAEKEVVTQKIKQALREKYHTKNDVHVSTSSTPSSSSSSNMKRTRSIDNRRNNSSLSNKQHVVDMVESEAAPKEAPMEEVIGVLNNNNTFLLVEGGTTRRRGRKCLKRLATADGAPRQQEEGGSFSNGTGRKKKKEVSSSYSMTDYQDDVTCPPQGTTLLLSSNDNHHGTPQSTRTTNHHYKNNHPSSSRCFLAPFSSARLTQKENQEEEDEYDYHDLFSVGSLSLSAATSSCDSSDPKQTKNTPSSTCPSNFSLQNQNEENEQLVVMNADEWCLLQPIDPFLLQNNAAAIMVPPPEYQEEGIQAYENISPFAEDAKRIVDDIRNVEDITRLIHPLLNSCFTTPVVEQSSCHEEVGLTFDNLTRENLNLEEAS